MSDDEYASPETPSQALTSSREQHHGPGSSTGKRVPSHRKGPRFSWTPAYEATFFRSLCDSVQRNLKDNHSFKQEAWERAIETLIARHGAYPTKGHLVNKSDNARKKFRLWRGLRENPDFLYNPATKNVTADDEAWAAHIKKEPLARSLRGRPFEHEEYMEILFPDVIGSGGAPKRITKPKRKETSTAPDDIDTPGTAIMELLPLAADNNNNGNYHHHIQPVESTIQPQAVMQRQTPTAALASNNGVPIAARPTPTNIPHRASTSALTPPEDAPHTRKRFLPNSNSNNGGSSSGPAEKRRRTTHTSYVDLSHPSQLASPDNNNNNNNNTNNNNPPHASRHIVQDSILSLAEALKTRDPPPRWPEQAMEIFFRDFADEDMDLQLKIAEKALLDSNKAMMFCQMPVPLRVHWVGRLREVHNRAMFDRESGVSLPP